MMTADPRLTANARIIHTFLTRAMELSHFGAKGDLSADHSTGDEPNIPVWIKNSFAPQDEARLANRSPHEMVISSWHFQASTILH